MAHYETLGVNEKSGASEIKKAYRKLSMMHHPDKGGNAEIFKNINEAYQILGDDEKKQRYDMEQRSPFGGVGVQNGFPFQDDNIFKMFFGGGQGQGQGRGQGMNVFNDNMRRGQFTVFHNGVPIHVNRPRNIQPIIKTVEIDIRESYAGVNIPIEIERTIEENNVKKCEKETVYIDIEPGIDNNEILMIKEKGNIRDNMRGDVKIFIKIINKTNFKRVGLDLVYEKTITLKEALIGFSFKIDHINGKSFTINNLGGNVIKPDYAKIASGMGMKRNEKFGNLIIKFIIIFPNTLTEDQKKRLDEIL
jgi:DnaJ family protein A protein 2